jgi:hypothetical protein
MVADSYATGEGSTVCLMAMSDNVKDAVAEDYFLCFFDYYYANLAEIVTEERFMEYKNYIPEAIQRYIRKEVEVSPHYMWYSMVHLNYG